MQGKTHARGGEVAAMTGYLILSARGSLHPELIPGVVSFAVIYPFAIWGSTAPDQDQNSHAIPSKDVVSLALYHVLHLTTHLRRKMYPQKGALYEVSGILDAKHRSWQTHSFEALLLWFWLASTITSPTVFSGVSSVTALILQLVFTGIALGWAAHIVLDGLTPEGIWIATFHFINKFAHKGILPEKLKIVPQRKFFATGNGWENGSTYFPGIRSILSVLSVVLFLILILDWFNLLNPLLNFLVN